TRDTASALGDLVLGFRDAAGASDGLTGVQEATKLFGEAFVQASKEPDKVRVALGALNLQINRDLLPTLESLQTKGVSGTKQFSDALAEAFKPDQIARIKEAIDTSDSLGD